MLVIFLPTVFVQYLVYTEMSFSGTSGSKRGLCHRKDAFLLKIHAPGLT